jgi:hypothetical protein
MPNFYLKFFEPSNVGGAVHQALSVYVGKSHIANGLTVQTSDGKLFVRVFDYDKPAEADLYNYFSSLSGVSDVTFSRPL